MTDDTASGAAAIPDSAAPATATLFPYDGLGDCNGASAPWLSTHDGELRVGDHRGVRRRLVPGRDIDLMQVFPAQPEAGRNPGDADTPKVPPSRVLGHAVFTKGSEDIVSLRLADWGAGGAQQMASPAWHAERPGTAAGVTALAERLGIETEHTESRHTSSKAVIPSGKYLRIRGFLVSAGFGIPLSAVGVLCFLASLMWEPLDVVGRVIWAVVGTYTLLASILLLVLWALCARDSRELRQQNEVVLRPFPAGPTPRAFARFAHMIRLRDRLVFQGADGAERTVPLRSDANGPARVVLRGHGTQSPSTPSRVQFCDRRETVLVELGWDDWFGGPGGNEKLTELCEELGLAFDPHETKPDDTAAHLVPMDSRQARRSHFARNAAVYHMVFAPAFIVVWAWLFQIPWDWSVIPAYAALAVSGLTSIATLVYRRAWLARPSNQREAAQ